MKKGFTLLELIIVVIILGILISIAVPRYAKVRYKAEAAEALTMLGTLRSAAFRYYAAKGSCIGLGGVTGQDFSTLDVGDPNRNDLYPNRLFDYDIFVMSDTEFEITAFRNFTNGGDGMSSIMINEKGEIMGTRWYSDIK